MCLTTDEVSCDHQSLFMSPHRFGIAGMRALESLRATAGTFGSITVTRKGHATRTYDRRLN